MLRQHFSSLTTGRRNGPNGASAKPLRRSPGRQARPRARHRYHNRHRTYVNTPCFHSTPSPPTSFTVFSGLLLEASQPGPVRVSFLSQAAGRQSLTHSQRGASTSACATFIHCALAKPSIASSRLAPLRGIFSNNIP
ncbi:uncharacterized protein K460DRAFT_148706 [Cucurbitaria berberidis CBS 394.84]|uniref:Uncharacterized protein n=1 Tax=Cucurbitaria berberidis CBS 394.84 TaxID=1168544 RepID=A0A9P4L663_9PLEO|nr:uncharacterized protein K460DRAFT_148706 [Cucurbitaria berberidis CBS 394.84]KAF1843636.1 hypothetical protein K460DRAFT_148706 [Cucurbitaria berberidis CBS 394.84]